MMLHVTSLRSPDWSDSSVREVVSTSPNLVAGRSNKEASIAISNKMPTGALLKGEAGMGQLPGLGADHLGGD